MSADNWTTCPACTSRITEERQAKLSRLVEAYGKVPVDEYEALKLDAVEPVEVAQTFREDYEFSAAETGVVFISYSGRCETCGVGTSFQLEHSFWPEKLALAADEQLLRNTRAPDGDVGASVASRAAGWSGGMIP